MEYLIKEILSNGFVVGKIKAVKAIKHKNEKKDIKVEMEKFNKAKKGALKTISDLKEKEPSLSEYLIIQELMINDPLLTKSVTEFIEADFSAAEACKKAMDMIIANLLNSDSQYLKERVADIEDIANILINNINGIQDKKDNEKYVLLVDDLLPSYLVNNHNNVVGIIAAKGGFTSHSAIIARIWDIPYVIASVDAKDNDYVLIDTRQNKIEINPSADKIEEYENEIREAEAFNKLAVKHVGFKFMANVATNRDIKRAMDYKFDGVGLFRTEFIFMNTNRPYTLIEHYKMYSTAAKACKGKPICFRTFDVKDDKAISYLKVGKRTVDTYKKNKDIFENQIKAILASNITGNVRIMFPMIETKEEFEFLKNWVIKIQKENNYNLPLIGMMLETKKALRNINDFTDVDFISIGTNDLTKELYNINRNETQGYETFIDDLINELRNVVVFTREHGILLSVCGELASIKDVAIRFYELGITSLSVSPAMIRNLNSAFTEFTNKKRKLYVVGDSTMAKFNDVSYLYPRCGYGEKLTNYCNKNKLEIVNLALSGRSAKSYLNEANYKKLFDEIKPSDFILIGFGHNDQKEDDVVRFSSAKTDLTDPESFQSIIYNSYVKKAYDYLAIPILVTPITRIANMKRYRGNVVHDTINGDYMKAIVELGLKKNITVINLTKPTAKYLAKIGYENAIYHHAIIKAKSFKNGIYEPEILSVDNTHLNSYGADYVAYLFAKEISKTEHPLRYFLNEVIEAPIEDRKPNPNYKLLEYKSPDLKSYKPKAEFIVNKDDLYGTYFGDFEVDLKDLDFTAKYDNNKYIVGNTKKIGKITFSSTCTAFLFKQIPINKNMRAKAKIKVLNTLQIKLAGFGLMIRDDCYINQKDPNMLVSSNEIACGMLTADNLTTIIYSKEGYTTLNKEPNSFIGYYKKNDVIDVELERLGQRISLSLTYKNKVYKKDYYDFDLKAVDNDYYYVGLYATNGTLVESEDLSIEILGDAKEA